MNRGFTYTTEKGTEAAPVAENEVEVMTEPVAEAVAEAPAETSVQNTNETMNANVNLQIVCGAFIANRDALRKVVKLENMKMHILAADILTTAGVIADMETPASRR